MLLLGPTFKTQLQQKLQRFRHESHFTSSRWWLSSILLALPTPQSFAASKTKPPADPLADDDGVRGLGFSF